MSTTTIIRDGKTVTISDNVITSATTAQPAAVVLQRHHEMPFSEAFTMGIITGVLLVLISKALRRRWLHQPDPQIADVSRQEVAALAARTATLEQIVTDPATRTAREIDALR